MIVLCCEYAKEYDITLNPKKTVCIKLGSKINNDEHVLISGFGHLQPYILINLFKTYCCYFFGSTNWGLNSAGFKSCTTAWNVGVRRRLNLPNTTRTWVLGHLLVSVHMTYKLYIRDYNLFTV